MLFSIYTEVYIIIYRYYHLFDTYENRGLQCIIQHANNFFSEIWLPNAFETIKDVKYI